jgi:hypothetical protein
MKYEMTLIGCLVSLADDVALLLLVHYDDVALYSCLHYR